MAEGETNGHYVSVRALELPFSTHSLSAIGERNGRGAHALVDAVDRSGGKTRNLKDVQSKFARRTSIDDILLHDIKRPEVMRHFQEDRLKVRRWDSTTSQPSVHGRTVMERCLII